MFANNHLIGESSATNFPSDPSGQGVLPVACNCLDVQHDYSERLKDVYKYKVLGGHHTSTARAQLHETIPYLLKSCVKCM